MRHVDVGRNCLDGNLLLLFSLCRHYAIFMAHTHNDFQDDPSTRGRGYKLKFKGQYGKDS
jgi:hypothetical protein